MSRDQEPPPKPDTFPTAIQLARTKLSDYYKDILLTKSAQELLGQDLNTLSQIEYITQSRTKALAQLFGGQFVPPSDEDLAEKFFSTIQVDPTAIDYEIDPSTQAVIHPYFRKFKGEGSKVVQAYNESNRHGAIIFPTETIPNPEKDTIRLYRGTTCSPYQLETAPLGRAQGIDIQDLYDYASGKITMDAIVEKITDPDQKRHIADDLKRIREDAKITEIESIWRQHTMWSSGVTGLDLWVSAANTPNGAFIQDNSSRNTYGDFISFKNKVSGIMVLDVPKSQTRTINQESGIFGCIRPEWIRAIIPASGKGTEGQLDRTISKVEKILNKND